MDSTSELQSHRGDFLLDFGRSVGRSFGPFVSEAIEICFLHMEQKTFEEPKRVGG